MGGQTGEFLNAVNAALANLAAQADLDLSPATLVKYALLIIGLGLLLWVLGDVYRGEIQNQDIEVDVIDSGPFGGQKGDLSFAKRTLDIRSASLPADVAVYHRFTILDGEREVRKRVRVFQHPFRLLMFGRASKYLPSGAFAMHREYELTLKNKAEKMVRDEVRRYRGNIFRRWHKGVAKDANAADAVARAYVARIHFPSNPVFLLFMHPDREVKATGWLTLLTSLFALFAQFLFQQPHVVDANEVRPRPAVHAAPPRPLVSP